jgi:hypothetical protein
MQKNFFFFYNQLQNRRKKIVAEKKTRFSFKINAPKNQIANAFKKLIRSDNNCAKEPNQAVRSHNKICIFLLFQSKYLFLLIFFLIFTRTKNWFNHLMHRPSLQWARDTFISVKGIILFNLSFDCPEKSPRKTTMSYIRGLKKTSYSSNPTYINPKNQQLLKKAVFF